MYILKHFLNKRLIMKRLLIVLCTVALSGITTAIAFAADVDFKTQDGVKKFWIDRDRDGNGSGSNPGE
jgi:hypothetical protein